MSGHFPPSLEKLSDTPFDAVMVDGVEITSRYGKIQELERMAHVIASLEPVLRRQIRGVWCDSKASHCYTVDLRSATFDAGAIGWALDRLFQHQAGGHNGLSFHVGGLEEPIVYEIPAGWDEDLP